MKSMNVRVSIVSSDQRQVSKWGSRTAQAFMDSTSTSRDGRGNAVRLFEGQQLWEAATAQRHGDEG
jgi:hypothetical protein